MNFAEMQAGYEKWLDFREDPDLLRIIYGAFVANRLQGNPVWLMIIGSAGCGKSELLMSISGAKNTYSISSLTPYALMSGYGDQADNSLINRLDGKVLLIKDLSSTTEIKAEDRGLLFSFLRDAYDGQVTRATGRGEIKFKGKFGIVAAGTLAIEHGRKMEALLGERFLYVRPRIHGEHIMEMSLKHASRKDEMRNYLKFMSAEFLDNYVVPTERTLSKSIVDTAKACAKMLVQTRSTVVRDYRTKEIEFPAEVLEIPTRVYEQLALFALALKSLDTDNDLIIKLIKRVSLDSIPYIRMKCLEALVDGAVSNTAVAVAVKLSRSYTSRCLEDMEQLGVLGHDAQGSLVVASSMLDAMLRNGVRKP